MKKQAEIGIIFDLDGTLIDTIADIAAAIQPILREKDYPAHRVVSYKRFVGSGLRNTLINALPADHGLSTEEIDQMYTRMLINYRAHPYDAAYPYDGIPRLLHYLDDAAIPKAILSNKVHDITHTIVDHLLGDFSFVSVQGLSDEFPRKPDPSSALSIAQKMGLSPSRIVLIGDSEVDFKTARAAGMYPIVVSWGFSPSEELCKNIPEECIVDDQRQLLELISTLSAKA